MANFAQSIMCGIDVSKDTLDIATSEEITRQIPNTRTGTGYLLPPGGLPTGRAGDAPFTLYGGVEICQESEISTVI